MSVLFSNVSLLPEGDAAAPSGPTNVLVRGSRIAAVGPAVAAPDEPGITVIDGTGHLLMPGLVNGHFHSPVNHMKGALDSLPLEIFMLYESPSVAALMPTPREAYIRTLLAAMEMLRNGVTAVQDDAFFVPHPTPEIVDAVMQAYLDVGIRARVALDQPNLAELDKLPFLGQLVPPALRAELARPPEFNTEALLAAYDRLIGTWHGRDGGRLKAAVSCSAPQRVTPEYFAALDERSRALDLPFYVHMLETKLQRVFGLECWGGRSLVRHTADLGLLSPRMNIIHAIWVDDADLDLIAAAGSVIAHNPVSNLRLGSGVMRFRAVRDRGIPICLGTDEAIADDSVNMWGVAKMAGLVHNIDEPDYDRWPRAGEILDAVIRGGARAMGEAGRLGTVEPGREADLILLDLDTAAFTPINDLRRQLVYCENGSSVRLTMVAGRIVFRDGKLATVDEKAIRAEARAIAAERAPALAEAASIAGGLLPYYRRMYDLAVARDVGMNRRLSEGLR